VEPRAKAPLAVITLLAVSFVNRRMGTRENHRPGQELVGEAFKLWQAAWYDRARIGRPHVYGQHARPVPVPLWALAAQLQQNHQIRRVTKRYVWFTCEQTIPQVSRSFGNNWQGECRLGSVPRIF
jgi:hypothetical protein